MVKKVYSYLGENSIGIEAPLNVLNVAEGNIEEIGMEQEEFEGIVKAWEGELRAIRRNRVFPYLSTHQNKEREFEGCDYVRYDTLVQTIWKKNEFDYEIRNNLPDDETGVLKCFKKIYYALHGSKNKAMIHSSVIEAGQKGILIIGRKRSGKTTIAFNMIDRLGASMVEGGTSFINYDDQLIASYIPRPIFARFSTISSSPYLSQILEDLNLAESKQPWDLEGIQEIVAAKTYSIDGGLNFSRRAFRKLSGKRTLPYTKIKTIIFPTYSGGGSVRVAPISIEEAYKRIIEREFKMDTQLGEIKDQNNMTRPEISIITPGWLSGLRLITVSFDGNKDISNALLEDLVD